MDAIEGWVQGHFLGIWVLVNTFVIASLCNGAIKKIDKLQRQVEHLHTQILGLLDPEERK